MLKRKQDIEKKKIEDTEIEDTEIEETEIEQEKDEEIEGVSKKIREDESATIGREYKKRKNNLRLSNLNIISYYDIINMKFDKNQIVDEKFILKVFRNVNQSIIPVKKNNKPIMGENLLSEILYVVERARIVLTNQTKKKKYDEILNYKNKIGVKFCDTAVKELADIRAQIENVGQTLYKSIGDDSVVSKPSAVHRIRMAVKKILEEESKKPVKVKRPLSANRIQINTTLKPEEMNMTRDEIEQVYRIDFQNYGQINLIYVCPALKERAIIEFCTLEAITEALKRPPLRYTVKEFTIANFYSPVLFNTIDDKINYLNNKIEELKNYLIKPQ